jgi:hypothetical protein
VLVNVAPTKPKKRADSAIAWITVTYRSVILSVIGAIILAAIGFNFAFPKTTENIVNASGNLLSSLLSKIGGTPAVKPPPKVGDQKASFTMLDGSVKVKKKSSNTWVNAAYDVPLEKGDVVQTGAEGMAKIVFADLTNYTVKQDSLIVIEENSTNAEQQTRVAVEVTTGTVDLSTATYSHGSKSEVIMAGSKASLAPESSAVVRNDPRSDSHEILLKKGSGDVERNGEVVSLSNYEKVSFKSDSVQMVKDREVGPPTLIDPSNMMPIFSSVGAGSSPVRFTWTPIDGVKGYRVRIAKNPYFTQLVMEKNVSVAEMQMSDIPEGAYYWSVQSIDDRGRESVESERNRFTVIPKNTDAGLSLELEPFVQHGRIIEVRGKTDSTARVMVNGGEVPVIGGDGRFRYLTPPLPNGENVITITAQNSRGGVSTQTKKVVIQ